MKLIDRYTTNTKVINNGPGFWDHLLVEIFDNGEKIGEYKRNYHTLMHTFCPFQQNGKHYALYSKDYTATRVMSLPDCKDIGGEENDAYGFCPMEYYVPCDIEDKDDENIEEIYLEYEVVGETLINDKKHERYEEVTYPERLGTFGFISGCVWGDDSSSKVQYLDLSRISEGVLKREKRFGYLELPVNHDRLKDCITIYDNEQVVISTRKMFSLKTGRVYSD